MAQTRAALGLELVGREVRLALVESGPQGLTVRSLQTVTAVEDLARVLRTLPRRPSAVTCAVSLEHGTVRILTLPPTTDENLERVVTMEAETVLPLEAEELALAQHVIGMTEQSRLEVLLAAARQSVVQDALKRVNCAPWVSASVTVSAIALMNAFQQLRGAAREPIAAVLKIEEADSELVVFDRSRILLAQSIPLGTRTGAAVPQPDDAKQAIAAGAWGDTAPAVAAAEGAHPLPWLPALAQQVRYALQSLSYERGVVIDRLSVCGAGASVAEMDWQLSQALDLSVAVLNASAEAPDGAAYTVAFGCAAQSAGVAGVALNLTPTRVVVAREVEWRRQARFSWAVLAIAVFVGLGLVFGAAVMNRKQALAVMQEKMAELSMDVPPSPIPAKELEASVTDIGEAVETRVTAARALSLFSRAMPRGAWLAELTYNAETGCLARGYSTLEDGAQRTQIALLKQQAFDEVTLDFRTEERISNVPVWGFQITCKLREVARARGRTGARRR